MKRDRGLSAVVLVEVVNVVVQDLNKSQLFFEGEGFHGWFSYCSQREREAEFGGDSSVELNRCQIGKTA